MKPPGSQSRLSQVLVAMTCCNSSPAVLHGLLAILSSTAGELTLPESPTVFVGSVDCLFPLLQFAAPLKHCTAVGIFAHFLLQSKFALAHQHTCFFHLSLGLHPPDLHASLHHENWCGGLELRTNITWNAQGENNREGHSCCDCRSSSKILGLAQAPAAGLEWPSLQCIAVSFSTCVPPSVVHIMLGGVGRGTNARISAHRVCLTERIPAWVSG